MSIIVIHEPHWLINHYINPHNKERKIMLKKKTSSMEGYYFITGFVIRDLTNPALILLNALKFKYEIIICHNAIYNKEKHYFGKGRDLCDLFIDQSIPLRFVDKVQIIKDDKYHFPIRVIGQTEDAKALWMKKIGINDLDEIVNNKYTPYKIMSFSTLKNRILTSEDLMDENQYFSKFCDRRILVDIEKRILDTYLSRYTFCSKNSDNVYEFILPNKRENYHLQFVGSDPIWNENGLDGGVIRFKMKIMKYVYEKNCPFGLVSLPGNEMIRHYVDPKMLYNSNRFKHYHQNAYVILGPIRQHYLCYCRNTGEVKLSCARRNKIMEFVNKNLRNSHIVHFRKEKGTIFPGVVITRIKPNGYKTMITALKNLRKNKHDYSRFYKNGAVIWGRKYYKPKKGTTTFDYSNFGATCLEHLKISPAVSKVCQWLIKNRRLYPKCKLEISRIMGNLKHNDLYAHYMSKIESVNVMLKTIKLNRDKSLISVCKDSVTYDGYVEKCNVPYANFDLKIETRLRPKTCYYYDCTRYFGINDLDNKLVLKGVIGKSSSVPVVKNFIETILRREIYNLKNNEKRDKFYTSELIIRPAKEYLFLERPDDKTKFYPGEFAYQDCAQDIALCYANMRDNKFNSKILFKNKEEHNESSVVHKFFSKNLVHVNTIYNLDFDKYESLLLEKLRSLFKILLRAYPKRKIKLQKYYASLIQRIKRDFCILSDLQKGVCVPGAFFDSTCIGLFSKTSKENA